MSEHLVCGFLNCKPRVYALNSPQPLLTLCSTNVYLSQFAPRTHEIPADVSSSLTIISHLSRCPIDKNIQRNTFLLFSFNYVLRWHLELFLNYDLFITGLMIYSLNTLTLCLYFSLSLRNILKWFTNSFTKYLYTWSWLMLETLHHGWHQVASSSIALILMLLNSACSVEVCACDSKQ